MVESRLGVAMSLVWNDLKQSAEKAMEANDWSTALSDWEAALKEAESFPDGDGRQVTTLEGLARTRFSRGDHDEAEFLYKRTLVIRRDEQGKDHKDVASVERNLGVVLFTAGRYSEAQSHFEKALNLKKAAFGDAHIEVGRTIYLLAMACHAQGHYDEADTHYRKSLDIKNKALGNNSPELINLLRNYADLLRKTSRDSIAGQMEQFAKGIEAKQKH